MANSTVIREFLVALGFQVDEKGLKKFETGVEDATKGVKRLVATISGAALTIGAGVTAFASKLEGLYFASRRVGASANNLRALEGAAKDFGVSSESALGTVERLAAFMRNNPAGESYIASLGVKTRDANGNLRDTVDLVSDLGTELAKRPQWLSKQFGDTLGIDENLLLAMRDPAFLARLHQIRSAASNNGMDRATKDAHAWMTAIRGVGRQFENLGVKVEGALLRKMGPLLDRFSAWFDKNADKIAERVADIALAVVSAVAAMTPAISWVVEKFIWLDQATDGWSTKIMLAVAAFKILGGFQLIGGIWKMVAALRAMAAASAAAAAASAVPAAAGAAGAAVAGAGGAAAGTAAGAGAAGAGGAAAGAGILARFLPWAARIGGGLGLMFYSGGTNEGEQAELDRRRSGSDGGSTNDAAAFFQRMGWTKEQASGIVANLRAESGMRPDAVGDGGKAYGLAQWHPDRQANFAQWAGKDIRESTLMEQLQFVNHELTQGAEQRAGALLRAAKNAQQAGEIVSRYYERPAQADVEAARRGQASVALSNDVKIYVNGSDNPVATGRAVASEQDRVNDNLVRNMQGAYG